MKFSIFQNKAQPQAWNMLTESFIGKQQSAIRELVKLWLKKWGEIISHRHCIAFSYLKYFVVKMEKDPIMFP